MKYTLYTKFCVKCVAPDELQKLKNWCETNKHTLDIVRTTYRPEAHKEASSFWGEENYTMFVRDENEEKNVDFYEFIKNIGEKDQPKRIKKSKPVKEGTKK